MNDYYNTLGVAKTASAEEIKKAYRLKALHSHPDRESGDEQAFKDAAEAYKVLSDPQKRKEYDNPRSPNVINFDFSRQSSSFVQQGKDIQIALTITLEEAYAAPTKVIEYERQAGCQVCSSTGLMAGKPSSSCPTCDGNGTIQGGFMFGPMRVNHICPRCQGSGKVITKENCCKACRGAGNVPQKAQLRVKLSHGIQTGQAICFTGMGNEGRNGGFSGNAIVFVQVSPHPVFRRVNSDDLLMEQSVGITDMILGCKIRIPTLTDSIEVKVPPESVTDTILRVEGMGFTNGRTKDKGDIFVVLKVAMPSNLTDRQRSLIQEFAVEEAAKLEIIYDGKTIQSN